jgi:hypothetical protein
VTLFELYNLFPRLRASVFQVTSQRDQEYNCIAWSFSDDLRWWWPDPLGQYYWPGEVRREESVEAFIEAYRTHAGFELCSSANYEPEFEKIAIFAKGGRPTHAARQLQNGNWTSKLGELEDIEHQLSALEGQSYGRVAIILKRPTFSSGTELV